MATRGNGPCNRCSLYRGKSLVAPLVFTAPLAMTDTPMTRRPKLSRGIVWAMVVLASGCSTDDREDDGPPHEAQATIGDSGGAVFIRGAKRWWLAGVMISVAGRPLQRPNEALFGNATHAADLAAYAPEILSVIEAAPAATLNP